MKRRLLIVILSLMLAGTDAAAQFYVSGSESGTLRWSEISSAGYRIVYPAGMDSLARVYARTLESVREAVGAGTGMVPNAIYRRPMPVILHGFQASSNGMVTWTPRRMELFSTPEAFFPETTPWELHLAIHESRHVSQMQLGATRTYHWLKYPFGELVDGALAAVYGGKAFFEGDAVVAETSLTPSGRGRSADFLEYQRICFDNGEWRNYWRWLYGSQTRYTPDHYRAGYMLVAGARELYGEPEFTKIFYDRIRKRGITFFNTQRSIKELSGKNFRESFADISHRFDDIWRENRESRAPFMPSDTVIHHRRYFQSYYGLCAEDSTLFALRKGMDMTPRLVATGSNGREKRLREMSWSVKTLRVANGNIYWAETLQDLRWEMVSYSDIFCSDASGKVRRLTHKQRFFNPAVSPDGSILAVAEYPVEGGSSLVLLSAGDGSVQCRTAAPAGMQILESVWVGDNLYFNALCADGIGIYRASDFACVLAPGHSRMGDLRTRDGKILFVSDLNGVNELYSFDPDGGELMQLSSTRHGAHDFVFIGDSLYYTMGTPDAINIYKTAVSDLPAKPARMSNPYENPIAAALSEGEKIGIDSSAVEIGEARRYSRIAHAFNFHSWAPAFVDFDKISSLSVENIAQKIGIGATGFIQNELGNFYGSIGYHYEPRGNRHSGYARVTYTGLWPVLEATLNVNRRNAYLYRTTSTVDGRVLAGKTSPKPSISADILAYVPLNFSSGGWRRGVIPQVNFSISNDLYGKYVIDRSFISSAIMSRLSASVRAYTMMRVPSSSIYPRLGVGAEIGASMRPLLSNVVASNAYLYIYGYVPGILSTHGIRLSGVFVASPFGGMFAQETIDAAPRGFTSAVTSMLGAYRSRNKISIDYALPLPSLDWSFLCPVAYIRNIELTPHADFSFFGTGQSSGNLFSAGIDFCFRLGNLLWIPYDTRIGFSYDYNGGSAYDAFSSVTPVAHHHFGLVFSIDM